MANRDQISHPPSSHTQSIRPSSQLYRVPHERPLGSFPPSDMSHCSHPSLLHHTHPSMQFDNTPYGSDSCLSSLLPPGVDPASVDFRTFYPYIPNEVKHRKRTSRSQLKVLEEIFRRDTKPNAQLRKKLAKQLDMTARGVQVWFQNRRAKEKTQAKKALTASKTIPIPNLGKETQSTDLIPSIADSPQPSREDDPSVESPDADSPQDQSTPDAAEVPSDSPSASPTQFRPNSASALWQIPSNEAPEGSGRIAQSRGPETLNLPLHGLRRGSLPLISVTADNSVRGPRLDQLDPLSRRRSVDTSLHRLASHPYAHIAIAKNGALYGPSRYPSQMRLSSQPGNMHDNSPMHGRPSLVHRGSLPHELSALSPRHRVSLDSRGYHFSNALSPSRSSSSPLSAHSTNSGFNSALYSIPTRTIPSPIPGPLPRPDFSFGAPSLTPPTNSPSPVGPHCDSPEALSTLPMYALPRSDDPDTEDDGTSASYDALSRFGSIASLTGSESSGTSAYYSDVSSTGAVCQDGRRGSCSGQILDLMSELDVTSEETSTIGHGNYLAHEELNAPRINTCDDRQGVNGVYPSPSSALPQGCDQSPTVLQISRSSELAFALQNNREQAVEGGNDPHHHYRDLSDSPVTDTQGPSRSGVPYAYRQAPGTFHNHSASGSSSGSSMSLPVMEFTDKFGFEGDLNVFSPSGHYASSSYSPPADGRYVGDASFTRMEGQDLTHTTDFTQCGSSPQDVYSTYPPNAQSIAHPLEPFVQYS